MNLTTLYSFARKLSALSFIVLILIGNFYLLLVMLGQSPGLWLQVGSVLGIVGALLGGGLIVMVKIATMIEAYRGK